MYDFVDKLRHFLSFFAVFCFFYGGTWAQDQSVLTDLDLSKTPYSWLLVSSGSAVCRPIKTSYGWLDLTEGKMASAFTESGAVLWQQGLPAQAAGLACADQDGFAAVLLKGRRLCLLNPSGLVLWQKALDFEPKANPLFGRDGRFFVFGKSEAAAFGMNGVQKWKEKTEPLSSTLSPMQLDDGSLLLFLEEAQGSKSVGLRLSPFGAVLERIVFSGLVSAACSLENGVLLCFSDGSAGLCSVDKGEAKSKWVIKGLGPGQNPRFFPIDAFRAALAFSGAGGSRLAVINTKKAAAESVFGAADIKGLEYAQAYGDEIFLAAADFGALYTLAGKRTRGASFPARTKKFNWDYVLYGSGGNIIFTSRNWSVAGWRLLKASRPAASESYGSKRKNYKDFYKGQRNDFRLVQEAASQSRAAALKKGGYGENEKDYLFASDAVIGGMFEKLMKKNSLGGSIGAMGGEDLYSFSLAQESACVGALGLFGSAEAAQTLAKVLSTCKDESVLIPALKAVQDCGYDPTGAIMDSIESLVAGALPSQETLLKEACASLYSLCRFMGRPAINKKGLKILASLRLPQYPSSAKEEARNVYEKLAKLKF